MRIRRLPWHFLRRFRTPSLAHVKQSRRRYNFASSIRSIVANKSNYYDKLCTASSHAINLNSIEQIHTDSSTTNSFSKSPLKSKTSLLLPPVCLPSLSFVNILFPKPKFFSHTHATKQTFFFSNKSIVFK